MASPVIAPTLSELPADILLEVHRWLDLTSLGLICQVSRQCNVTASADRLWKSLCILDDVDPTPLPQSSDGVAKSMKQHYKEHST